MVWGGCNPTNPPPRSAPVLPIQDRDSTRHQRCVASPDALIDVRELAGVCDN